MKQERVEISIGVYGGTFDPIHHGHLILAREALEQLDLDEIIFVPTAISPHKSETPGASNEARLEMLCAAIEGEATFAVNDLELTRPPPSFTIETIENLRREKPSARFTYLVGEDNVPRLKTWHRFVELEKMVRFVVLNRTGTDTPHDYPTVRRKIDISATEIRNRVATRRSIRYLVPSRVEQIILQRGLYREPKK